MGTAIKILGNVAIVTGGIVFLASADADSITQQTLNVDGGHRPG